MKTSTFKRNSYWGGRKLGPTALIYIQFIRDNRLYGLEVGQSIRLLQKLATHEDASVTTNARALLKGIMQGREIFDEHPLISEFGRGEKSPAIYIHDAILNEIEKAIKAAKRARGGRDD